MLNDSILLLKKEHAMKGIRWLNIKTNTLYAMSIVFLFAASCFPLIGQQNNLAAMRAKAQAAAAAKPKAGQKTPPAGQAANQGARGAAFKKAQEKQAKRYNVNKRGLAATIPSAIPAGQSMVKDRFIQSEAHVYSPEVRKLIQANYDIIPYLDVISSCVTKEAELAGTHDVFYNGFNNDYTLLHDLERLLGIATGEYKPSKGSQKSLEEFVPLRSKIGKTMTAQEFLSSQFKSKGNVDDRKGEITKGLAIGSVLLSANLALFGSVGWKYECTWEYFMTPTSQEEFNPNYITAILTKYKIPHTYATELVALIDILRRSPTQGLLQIFIPREKVDTVAYVAWVKGIPANQKTIKWIMDKSRNPHDPRWAINQLRNMFKEEKQDNPLFKETLQEIEEGKFGIRDMLYVYRNKPWEIEHINLLQARLMITKEILLNPNSGVKFYRYSHIKNKDLEEYKTKLNAIIKKMVSNRTKGNKTPAAK